MYRLKDLPSRKSNVVKALVYASILTLVVSRMLLKAVLEKRNIDSDDIPRRRWAVIFCSITHELLARSGAWHPGRRRASSNRRHRQNRKSNGTNDPQRSRRPKQKKKRTHPICRNRNSQIRPKSTMIVDRNVQTGKLKRSRMN